jgi:hypothetical protein
MPGPTSRLAWYEGQLAESSEPGALIESVAACADVERELAAAAPGDAR